MPEPSRLRPPLLMIAAAVLFGTTGTAQALGPAQASPLSVGAVRQVVGGSALLLVGLIWWLRHHGARTPRWSRKVGWVLLGGLSVMAFQATFFYGTRLNGVAVGTVIALGSSPLFAGAFDALRGRPPTRRWAAATALAVAGIVLLSGVLGSAAPLELPGILASLVAGAGYAGYAVATSTLVQRGTAPLPTTAAVIGASGVVGAAILPFTEVGWLAEPGGLAMAGWLGLVTVVVSYLLMGTALRHLSAATAITLGLAEPMTAAVLGVLVLGERLGEVQWIGLVAVLAGVVVAGSGRARPRRSSPPADPQLSVDVPTSGGSLDHGKEIQSEVRFHT